MKNYLDAGTETVQNGEHPPPLLLWRLSLGQKKTCQTVLGTLSSILTPYIVAHIVQVTNMYEGV